MSASRNANGPAEAATSPDRGSNSNPAGDMEMNKVTNTTSPAAQASAVPTIKDIYDHIESIWCDIADLQRKAYLLSGNIDAGLNQGRGKVDGDTVTLMFQKRGIDVTLWLAGEVWSDAEHLVGKVQEVMEELEGALE